MNKRKPFMLWLGKALAVAAPFFITDRPGMVLAVPQDYATAAWPLTLEQYR